jgi:hypothetical protein
MNRYILSLRESAADKLKTLEHHINAVAAYKTAAYAVMVRPKKQLAFGETGLVPDDNRAVLAWYSLPGLPNVPAVLRWDAIHRAWVWHSTGAPMKQPIQQWLELPE